MKRVTTQGGLCAVAILCGLAVGGVARASDSADAAAAPVPLCGLETPGYSRHIDAEAGHYEDNVLAVPAGDNAFRVEGHFIVLRDDAHWEPTLTLLMTTSSGKYILRFAKEPDDTLLRVFTESGADKNVTREYDFDANPALTGPLRADVSWTPDGTVTTTVYTGPQGFDGPGETHSYKAGVPSSVKVIGSTGEIEVKALTFGKTCIARAAAAPDKPSAPAGM